MNYSSLSNKSLEEIYGDSIFSTPAVSVRIDDVFKEVITLLPHHLESFTDSLVVTQNDTPVGIIGGIEVLDRILKKPAGEFLNTRVIDVMSNSLVIVNKEDKLSELIKHWVHTKRAYAIIPNQYHGYSAISARKILEIGVRFKINVTVDTIPKKKIITFRKDETVKQIISRMFENSTRKLLLDGTKSFINDRIIIQKLVREYLHCPETFLNIQGNVFDLEQVKIVSDNVSISEACKFMQDMKSPYLMSNDKIISPWDIVTNLDSC